MSGEPDGYAQSIPGDEEAREELTRGVALDLDGKAAEAETSYAIASTSSDANIASSALSNIARLWALRGEAESSKSMFRRALEVAGPDADGSVALTFGLNLWAWGALDEAETSFRAATRSPRSDTRLTAHLNLGRLLWSTGNLDEAIEQLRSATAFKGSESIQAALDLGTLLTMEGRAEEAVDALHVATTSAEEEVACKALLAYGMSLARLERYEESKAAYDRALSMNCRDIRDNLLLNRANAYLLENDLVQAESMFRAVTAMPGNWTIPVAWFGLSQVLFQLDRNEEAIAALKEANAAKIPAPPEVQEEITRLLAANS